MPDFGYSAIITDGKKFCRKLHLSPAPPFKHRDLPQHQPKHTPGPELINSKGTSHSTMLEQLFSKDFRNNIAALLKKRTVPGIASGKTQKRHDLDFPDSRRFY